MDKRALAVLVASFGTIFTAFAIRYSYGVLLPEMLPSLAISKTEAGVIFASYFIAYTVASPVLGLLADRYDMRVLLTSFLAILGIGTLLMSYSSSPVNASLFFALAGIGAAVCWAPVMALVQRWSSDKRRGMTLAVIDVGSALGIIACSAAMPLIVVAHGWRTGWMGLGVLAFLIAGMNFFLVRNLVQRGNLQIAGLNGLLLGVAKEREIEGACLLGEVPMYASQMQNPMAALAVLKVLTKMLDIEVNTTELTLLADETKEKMKLAAAEAMGKYIDYFTQPIWEHEEEEEEE